MPAWQKHTGFGAKVWEKATAADLPGTDNLLVSDAYTDICDTSQSRTHTLPLDSNRDSNSDLLMPKL